MTILRGIQVGKLARPHHPGACGNSYRFAEVILGDNERRE